MKSGNETLNEQYKLAQFLESLPGKVEYELQRLLRSGAVDDTTPLNVLYAVALRNVQILYDDLKSRTARNLLKI